MTWALEQAGYFEYESWPIYLDKNRVSPGDLILLLRGRYDPSEFLQEVKIMTNVHVGREPPAETPTAAIVPVKSSWASKINWAQFIGLAASVLTVVGIDITPEVQVQVLAVINGIIFVVTWVLRTWFTKDVTAASVANQPALPQSSPVSMLTPPGPVVSTIVDMR